jgi:hypothetical protein
LIVTSSRITPSMSAPVYRVLEAGP